MASLAVASYRRLPAPIHSSSVHINNFKVNVLNKYNPIRKLFSTILWNANPIILNVRNIVGVGRVLLDVEYFVNARYKAEKTIFGIIGNSLISFADFTSIFECLNAWKILTYARIAAVMGSINLLKPLTDFPFGVVVGCLTVGAYVFVMVDSIYRFAIIDQTPIQKRQAMLDVVNSVAQIALSVAFIIGVANIYVLIGLAACAALFGVISFFHRWYVARNTMWTPAMK